MKEKLSILNDFVFVVGVERETDVNKFLFVASPRHKGDDEGASWEGRVGAIKKAIESSLKEQKSMFTKKIAVVQTEMTESSAKIAQLEEKVDGLQNMN